MEDNAKEERSIMPDKILVVDDEVEIADLIEVYLNNENYSVFKFYSAKEALECINTTNLDLAILDVMLPDISCMEFPTSSTLDSRAAIILVSQTGIGAPRAPAFSMMLPASVRMYQMTTKGLSSTV